MNIENRATKIHIKNLPPIEALDKIDKYMIPTPHKEVLIAACVFRKEGYSGVDFLENKYNIHIGYWTFGRRLKEALEMYRKSDQFLG